MEIIGSSAGIYSYLYFWSIDCYVVYRIGFTKVGPMHKESGMSQNGKGDKDRVTDLKKYGNNYDKIKWPSKDKKEKEKKNGVRSSES